LFKLSLEAPTFGYLQAIHLTFAGKEEIARWSVIILQRNRQHESKTNIRNLSIPAFQDLKKIIESKG
jgi:hypothetical protein